MERLSNFVIDFYIVKIYLISFRPCYPSDSVELAKAQVLATEGWLQPKGNNEL